MPTLDDALTDLAALGDRPPWPPPPGEEVRARAEALRRRRRQARSLTGLAAVVALVGGVAVTSARQEQVAAPSPPSSTTSTTAPEVTLDVAPAEGLQPNQAVIISLPEAATEDNLIFAQCGREALQGAPESWCQIINATPTETSRRYRVRVRRVIQTTNGQRIDCSEEAGRCVLGLRSGRDYTAPIAFDPTLAPLVPPELDVAMSEPFLAVVRGSGYEPGAEVWLSQCRAAPGQAGLATAFQECDRHMTAVVVPDAEGDFVTEFRIRREIFEDYTGWGPCQPCQVQAFTTTADTLFVEVDATSGLTGRPTVEIRPAGPYRPGQVVELHGTGFAPNSSTAQMSIGWCLFTSTDPDTEAEGTGSGRTAQCRYPDAGLDSAAPIDDQGSFTIPAFPLPDEQAEPAFACRTADTCGLAWHPGEASLPYFVTEFQMISP